jgi:hypothetical protein
MHDDDYISDLGLPYFRKDLFFAFVRKRPKSAFSTFYQKKKREMGFRVS